MQTAQNNRLNKKTIRIGFDLDGVLLYNPVRILRPFISVYKKAFLKKKRLHFYFPQSRIEKQMWRLIHKSSIYLAPGIDEIKKLVDDKKIEAFIITARYEFMGPELLKWCREKKLDLVFSEIHYNKQNEQPHLFKEKMIKKLKLHYFVEDNFDIVHHVSKKTNSSIIWIYNLFDRGIVYPQKFPYLKKAVLYIKDIIETNK